MCEILFRGKRIDNGEWVSSGNLITFNDEGDGMMFFIPELNSKCTCTHDERDNILSFDSGTFYKVDPSTVGQFTGLTDKNGKKIFEGDIVANERERGVVSYGDFNCDCCYGVFGWSFGNADIRKYNTYEVNGNIHDNPELLEV